MSDLTSRIIVGNIVIYPVLRQFLIKSHYFMSYDPETEKITFRANHNRGGEDLFQIRNASYENAVKLANELGLKSIEEKELNWSKWNPIYDLYYDKSEDSEKIRTEMLKLGLPFRVLMPRYVNGENTWAWSTGGYIYSPPMWTVDQVLDQIRKESEMYKEQLGTTP